MTDSTNRRQRFDIYLNTPYTKQLKAAEAVLVEENSILSRFAWRYTADYLSHPNAFMLDSVQLPLGSQVIELPCNGGIPSVLDDYLPDDWGRKILSQLAFYRDGKSLNRHSCIDMLGLLGSGRIGALCWVPEGEAPTYTLGSHINKMHDAEAIAQVIDQPIAQSSDFDELSLLYLANAGSGVGGARPKALLHDEQGAFLAKFNRQQGDEYNNARVELACLQMAKTAGLNVFTGDIVEGINGREVLLLHRFDIADTLSNLGTTQYYHLITVNGMLKEKASQRDRGGVFRYDDIATLIQKYSCNVEADLEQLLRMMLFNVNINNTDTHERNFSFIYNGNGYRLAPAYDLVPSLTKGAYPVAGFKHSPMPPSTKTIQQYGKVFGLAKPRISNIAEQVLDALEQWEHFAENCRVSDKDNNAIKKIFTQ